MCEPQNEPSPEFTRRHSFMICVLCLTMLSQSYLLISVFPYAGYMALQLVPGTTAQNAGAYAGFIASSFMMGRVASSYLWGKWADVYGRKFVLFVSLIMSAFLSILFGLSFNFGWAILIRFCMGLGNGIVGNAKTMVSELAGGNAKVEKRSMGIVISMWGWGFLISPAISGFLADPVKQYPNNPLVIRFQGFLSEFPFILPNIVAVLLCTTATILLHLFVDETLPTERRRSPTNVPLDILRWCSRISCPLFRKRDANLEELPIVEDSRNQDNHYSSTEQIESKRGNNHEEATIKSIWQRTTVRRHLLAYWFYSYITVAVDEAFPLFCIGTIGLSESKIGQILATSGLIFGIAQYFVYSAVVSRFGLYTSVLIGAFLSVPIVILLPVALVWTNGGRNLTAAAFWWMVVIMALERIFGIVFFSSVSIAINHTVATDHRASLNGLSMLGGSLAKGSGPAFAGLLVSFCLSSGLFSTLLGGVMVFVMISLIALSICVLSCWLLQKRPEVATLDEET